MQPFFIFKLAITFIKLQLKSQNLILFLDNFITDNLDYILQMPKFNMTETSRGGFFKLLITFILLQLESQKLIVLFSFLFSTVYTIYCKYQNSIWRPVVSLHYRPIASRIIKFNLFYSVYDFQQLSLCIAITKIQCGSKPPL